MEIQVLLEEMLERGVSLERQGEPERIASNFVHGVASVELAVM